MQVSRRDFLRVTAGAGAGTAIGGLVGLGATLAPARAQAPEVRIKDAKPVPMICPFCSVGCATLIQVKDGRIVNIEGDPRSPHNEGTLCPKGAAIYQLHVNPNRATKVLHRKPGAKDWEVVELEWAMDRVAELTKKTRDETFVETLANGKVVNMTPAIFALGGATLDNEFNHLCQKFVVNYTNAATIINKDFKDTEELEGVFSGLAGFTEPGFWPYNGNQGRYDPASWQYEREPKPPGPATQDLITRRAGPPFDDLVRSLKPGKAHKDPTLQDPHCVFQILKRHFSRYTPEMVEQVCGSPKEKFIQVAEALLANSARDRTSAFAYAVAWTQHTYGVQMMSCCALLQLMLGNIGRPGAGVMALRGHAAIQGSTDVPTLYHSIHGYMNAPSALRPHETLRDYMAAETSPTSYYGNLPKFLVSYLKSMYGAAATAENDFGYDWHPKILGDHSHIASFAAMADGKVKGMCCVGQNPATSLNGGATRQALRRLQAPARPGVEQRLVGLRPRCGGGGAVSGRDQRA